MPPPSVGLPKWWLAFLFARGMQWPRGFLKRSRDDLHINAGNYLGGAAF
jgi:hypothetical protein